MVRALMPAIPSARSAWRAASTMRLRVSGTVRIFSARGGQGDREVAAVHELLERPGGVGAGEEGQALAHRCLVEVVDLAAGLVVVAVGGGERVGHAAGATDELEGPGTGGRVGTLEQPAQLVAVGTC